MKKSSDAAEVAVLAAELRALVGKLKRRLREQADLGDLTWSQVSVLARLERGGPATVTTLAQAEAMRPQSMGATVSALEVAGLVKRAPDPADGRQALLSITAACRKWLKAGRAAREDWLCRAIQTHLAPKERKELASAVEMLERLVDS